jgi:hypothetical protein
MNNTQLVQFKTILHKLIKEEIEAGAEEKSPSSFENVIYDLVLSPQSLEAAVAALGDVKNYGIYANNLRDPKKILKIFGPSIPAQKANVAWAEWEGMNEDERLRKAQDIKNRLPQAWSQLETELEAPFDKWSSANDGEFEDFLTTLNAKELRAVPSNSFFGSRGANYYPMKTPENLKRYSGVMTKDKDFDIVDNKIIFPQKKNPFENKVYLEKVLKTIMSNAKVGYNLSQQEAGDQPKTSSNTQGVVEKINFVKTFSSPELAKKFVRLIPKDFATKTTSDNGKVTVSDITEPQKKNLMATALKFADDNAPKKKLKEEEEEEMDWNSISDLETELRRLKRWADQYNSHGSDGQINRIEKRLELLKSKDNLEESSSVHTVKFSKENNTYQIWKGGHIVTDYATPEKAKDEAKRLNHLDDAKKTDRAQVKETVTKIIKEILKENKFKKK